VSGKLVNLRRARKQKARAQSRAEADANAARRGEAKPARSLRAARAAQEARRLEGHRLAPDGADASPAPDVPGSTRDLDE
jgi:hypothetical protein